MNNDITLSKYIRPAKIFGNLYFVGTRAVCTHLIDTRDGLIIIDPGSAEDLHVIIGNMRELGFDPMNIRYIVVSHAHYDHMDSVRDLSELTGAEAFIGKADLPLLTGETYHFPIRSFEPDVLLCDGDVISLGNTNIKCVSTPGHTDGTTSFFFDVTDGEKTYRAGMFGGAGTNTLRKDFMQKHGIPEQNRYNMIDSINKIKGERVDIFLGNHLENNNTEGKLLAIANGEDNPFLKNGQTEWNEFLNERLNLLQKIIEEDL